MDVKLLPVGTDDLEVCEVATFEQTVFLLSW